MKRDDMRASRGARPDESEEGAVPVSSSDDIRVHAVVAGLVQGVGFRYFTVMTAGKLGLGGWVRNCYDWISHQKHHHRRPREDHRGACQKCLKKGH